MSNKILNNRDFAKLLLSNNEKEDIIATIFDYFQLDCLERCNINPSQFDELVREFNDTDNCDIDILTSIIDMIKTGKASSLNKEND